MAAVMEFESGRSAYPHIVNMVRHYGTPRSPRDMKTYDAGHITIMLDTPYDALPLEVGRGLNPAVAAGEAIQLIAGRARHDLLPSITPAFTKYAEPGGRFHGAYGDRIGNQVGYQIAKLKADRDTRQAVITLWDPKRDNEEHRRDYPCTVALNFAIIDNMLELRTLMRSNDVWLGLPYDMFQFTQLQLTAARALGIPPGRYTHETWSLHIYEEHVELADKLTLAGDPGPYQPTGFGMDFHDPHDDWARCRARAAMILGDKITHVSFTADPLTESEEWYVEQLAPHLNQ